MPDTSVVLVSHDCQIKGRLSLVTEGRVTLTILVHRLAQLPLRLHLGHSCLF